MRINLHKMNAKRMSLSSSILDMKFMKRTKDMMEKQQFQKEGEEYFGSQITARMRKESDKVFIEPSYVFCEELIDGRLSFQGMNPTVEKLMEERNNKNIPAKEETKEEVDMSEEQMSIRWQKIQGKFDAKRKGRKQHQNVNNEKNEPMRKKLKFLKPVD